MMDLQIKNKNFNIIFYLKNIKIILTNNFEIRDSIITSINSYFNKISDSEYAVENDSSNQLQTDNKRLNISDYNYFYINDQFDIFNDLKLGSKSLMLRYILAKTEKIEYLDEYQSFKTMCQIINDEINELIQDDSNITFNCNLEMEKNKLVKLLSMNLLKDDLEINEIDMSYNDKIIHQIRMIKSIVESNLKKSILIINIPIITTAIMNEFKLIRNAYVLVFPCVNKKRYLESINYGILNDNNYIDLYDDNALYDICMNSNVNMTIDECREKLLNDYID